MKYRDMAIAVTKIAGQELIDRAEELIPNTEGVKDINIWISIPSANDNCYIVPEIEVHTNVLPKRKSLQMIFDMRRQNDEN